jgi:hypothetical protein
MPELGLLKTPGYWRVGTEGRRDANASATPAPIATIAAIATHTPGKRMRIPDLHKVQAAPMTRRK